MGQHGAMQGAQEGAVFQMTPFDVPGEALGDQTVGDAQAGLGGLERLLRLALLVPGEGEMGVAVDEVRFADDEPLQRGHIGFVREPAGLVGVQQFVEFLDKSVEPLLRVHEHAGRIVQHSKSQFHAYAHLLQTAPGAPDTTTGSADDSFNS